MIKNTVKYCNLQLFAKYYDFIIGRTLSSTKTSVGNDLHNSAHQFQKFTMNSSIVVPEGIFSGTNDRFNGVIIDSHAEVENNVDFETKLNKSLAFWEETKKRGIWFKVHTEDSKWIPILIEKGFNFHHAKSGFVMLIKWLPKDESANIPVYAHTLMGVGGLVVSEDKQVLVVSDRFAMIPGSWKLPGGYVEPREDLVDAAKREVREETGIETEFDTVVSLRHAHGGGFGCSDLYVVIALKPKSYDIVKCEREIAKARWMPISEYLQCPQVHETNRKFLQEYLMYKENGIKLNWEKKQHEILKRIYDLYSIHIEK